MRKSGWKKGGKRAAAFICAAAVALGGCAGGTAAEGPKGSEPVSQVNRGKGGKDMEAVKPEEVSFGWDDYEKWNKLLADNQVSREFQMALKSFALRSGSRLLSDSEGNVNYSPLSLYYALALAACGAQGETASQLLNALGAEDEQQLARECRKFYQWWYYFGQYERAKNEEYGEGAYESAMELANSLWISGDLGIKEEYQALAAKEFFASSYGVDFKEPGTGERMGKWIGEHTRGVLEPELDLSPDTMLAILNTLYFYGGWKTPFSPSETVEDSFYLEDGTETVCDYLNRRESMGAFHRGEGYTVSCLTTSNRCRMVFLLPDEGRSVEEFLSSPERLASMDIGSGEWRSGEVTWKVPKISFGSSLELAELLEDMGIKRMFEEDAEFGKISEQPLYVSKVIQETHIGIDEKGVEGAAYTMLALEAAGTAASQGSAQMILDRPFLYGIQDMETGSWLFLGVCRNPAETDA